MSRNIVRPWVAGLAMALALPAAVAMADFGTIAVSDETGEWGAS